MNNILQIRDVLTDHQYYYILLCMWTNFLELSWSYFGFSGRIVIFEKMYAITLFMLISQESQCAIHIFFGIIVERTTEQCRFLHCYLISIPPIIGV